MSDMFVDLMLAMFSSLPSSITSERKQESTIVPGPPLCTQYIFIFFSHYQDVQQQQQLSWYEFGIDCLYPSSDYRPRPSAWYSNLSRRPCAAVFHEICGKSRFPEARRIVEHIPKMSERITHWKVVSVAHRVAW